MDLRSRRWSWMASSLLGLVLVAWGGSWWITQERPAQSRPPSASPTGDDGASAVVGGRRRARGDAGAPRDPASRCGWRSPTSTWTPRCCRSSRPDGVLTPPSDPQELGWWADGARPGDPRGSALVTGHTVSTGGGALDDLEDLDEGDRILVHSARKESDYAVESVEVLAKGDLADRAELLFSQAVPGRLVVVTCEDWNGARVPQQRRRHGDAGAGR